MAIAFQTGTTQGSDVNGNSRTATKPTGLANGDTLVAFVVRSDGSAAATGFTSTGFTSRAFFAGDGTNGPFGILTKAITDAVNEPASYTFVSTNASANDAFEIHLLRFSGVDNTDPIAVAASSGTTGTGSSCIAPGLTVPTGLPAQAMLLCGFVAHLIGTTNQYGWSVPTGMTECTDHGDIWAFLGVMRELRNSGTTGTRTATFQTKSGATTTSYTTNSDRGVSIVLRPASIGVTNTETGSAAPKAAGSGSHAVARTFFKAGGAVARGAGTGPDTVVRIITKAGGSAPRVAGTGPKIAEVQDRARAITTTGALQSTIVHAKNFALAVSTTMENTSTTSTVKHVNVRVVTRMESVSAAATFKAAFVGSADLGYGESDYGSGGYGAGPTLVTEMATQSVTYLQVFGRDEPPPYLEVITSPYIPPQRRSLRVIAQRIIGGQFLEWNVPLKNPEITYTLSGPTMIRGVIGPESQDIRDIGLDAWGTWLHIEENDEIKASGILLPQEIPGEYLNVEAAGVSYYPQDMPWKGHLSEIQIDPAEVIRRIWAHLQSYPEGKLNVTVASTTTPVRLGEAAYTENITNQDGTVTPREVPAKPYELNWWEAPDCGSEIDNLVRSTPMDFVERNQWNTAKTAVNNYIDLGYPRIGRRLLGHSAPRFVQNENATEMFVLGESPDLYASEVLVLGKGEGSKMIRGEVGLRNTGRLRRVAVRSDPAGISTNERAVAIGRDELRRRAALLTIGEVTIDSTNPLAPMGSFRVGDDILVQADVPYHGAVSLWHRIVSYTWSPDAERVNVQLRRSEQYM